MLPSFEDILALHKKCAPSKVAFDLIFTHSLIVSDIASGLIRQNPGLKINSELVKAGALLHDIGTYALFINGKFDEANYITHGVKGREILLKEGLDVRLARIAAHHTGVGLSKADIQAQSLPLPDEDFLAETIEERLVMYADKFHSKTPQFNSYETYAKNIARFGNKKEASFRVLKDEFGIPEIESLAKKYGHPIR